AGRRLAVLAGLADAAVRQQVLRAGVDHRVAEQLVVALPRLLALVEADLAEVDLELELKVALRRARPDGAGRGGERLKEALENLAVKGGRRHVGLAQPRHFVQAAAEFAPLLFDDLHIDLGIRTDAHGSASKERRAGFAGKVAATKEYSLRPT